MERKQLADMTERERLINYYSETWEGSIGEFVRYNSLNKSSFIKYLKNVDHKSKKVENALRNWQRDGLTASITVIPLHQFMAPIIPNDRPLKAIVFVDGDQASHQIPRLQWIMPDSKAVVNAWPIHVIVTNSIIYKDRPQSIFKNTYPWLQFVHCSSHERNAVDVAVVSEVERCRNVSRDVSFILLSADHFLLPLHSDLLAEGRGSTIVNTLSDDLALSIITRFNDDAIEISNQAMAFRDKLINTVRNRQMTTKTFKRLTSDVQKVAPHLTSNNIRSACEYIRHHYQLTPVRLPTTRLPPTRLPPARRRQQQQRGRETTATAIDNGEPLFLELPAIKKILANNRLDSIHLNTLVRHTQLSAATRKKFSVKGWQALFALESVQQAVGVNVERVSASVLVYFNTNTLRKYYRAHWMEDNVSFAQQYGIDINALTNWLNSKHRGDNNQHIKKAMINFYLSNTSISLVPHTNEYINNNNNNNRTAHPSSSSNSTSTNSKYLSHGELRKFYQMVWPLTAQEFCMKYTINPSSFHGWLYNYVNHLPIASAVRELYFIHLAGNVSVQRPYRYSLRTMNGMPADYQLREFYKGYWCTTNRTFCEMTALNINTFMQWLNNDSSTSYLCSNAIYELMVVDGKYGNRREHQR